MAYEEYSRITYQAECACGQGFIRYYKIYEYNDWGHKRERKTSIEIVCDQCRNKYHHESFDYIKDYLVPNNMKIPTESPRYDGRCILDGREKWVEKYSIEELNEVLAELNTCRYISRIKSRAASDYVNDRWYETKKKSVKPMILYLKGIIDEYDTLKINADRKRTHQEEYRKKMDAFRNELRRVLDQSVELSFSETKQDSAKHIEAQDDLDKYIEEHKDESLTGLEVDLTYEKDFAGLFWDTLYVKECTDQQYTKPGTLFQIEKKMVKRYLCVCDLCGREIRDCMSSEFTIRNDYFRGYYPVIRCDCHLISSFEAKAMDILNKHGIMYIREKSFDDLVGDSGNPLRFDFALFKEYDGEKNPIIDLIIELQGPHHYEKGYYDESGEYIIDDDNELMQNRAERKLERQRRYDQKKIEYCKQHRIKLACIKYVDDYKSLEKKINNVLIENGYGYLLNEKQQD